MLKMTMIVLFGICLAGCASRQGPAVYGNFVQDIARGDGKMMADDVAKKLAALYPPARTRLNLQQATADVFGVSLVTALRTRGYALTEFKLESPKSPSGNSAVGDAVALAYVVDQQQDPKLYRITVHVNTQLLSRLYELKADGIAPAGYWIRKE